jgi:hypothetical protein
VNALYMALDASYEEILWRMERIKKGELPSAISEASTPFQEVPEAFGVFLVRRYQPDLFISGTSESTWWCIGRTDPQPIHPSLDKAVEFMELLLHSHEDIGLLELLQSISLKPVEWTERNPLKAVLVLQKIPHPFTKWLEHQLGDLRAKGVFLDLTIVMFADAYPTSWVNVMKFWSHSLTDIRNLRPFRTPNTYLEPPMITVFTAGMGPMRGLKRPLQST